MAWGSVNVPGGAVGGDVKAAYNQANAAYDVANAAYSRANGAYNQANAAYNQANAVSAEIHAIPLKLGSGAKSTDSFSTAVGRDSTAYTDSTALGANAYAGGMNAVAIGVNSTASYSDIAIGKNARADYLESGAVFNAIAIGVNAFSSSTGALAVGLNSNSVGMNSISIGVGACTADGANSIALGYHSYAGYNASDDCAAIGSCSNASNTRAFAFGCWANASGYLSTALGSSAKASSGFSTAIGTGAVASNSNGIQLGNASSLSSITAKVSITVTSDERDKADITEVPEGATEFLKRVKAVTYVYNQRELYRPVEPKLDEDGNPILEDGVDYLTYKDRENLSKYGFCRYDKEAHKSGAKKGSRKRIGVLAQQVQTALAETYGSSSYANLVNDNLFDYDDVPDGIESTLAMNYEGFIPFLIKAVQELDARLSALEGV